MQEVARPDNIGIGRVLFLERPLAGLPFPTGFWVVCEIGPATVKFALLWQEGKALTTKGPLYEISIEDLSAFSLTDEVVSFKAE